MSTTANVLDLAALRFRRDEILERARLRGARNLRVFGSIARGEPRPDSDVDLLVEMDRGRSLIDLVGLGQDLEDLLGARVDVLSAAGLSTHLRQRIVGEAVPL
jgi:predicted nucleotidyltransferase